MTTTYDHDAVTALATMLADADEGEGIDTFELIATLKPLIPGPAFEALALSFDMCPIHLTDLDSCADDDALTLDEHRPLDTPPLTACRHLRVRD